MLSCPSQKNADKIGEFPVARHDVQSVTSCLIMMELIGPAL